MFWGMGSSHVLVPGNNPPNLLCKFGDHVVSKNCFTIFGVLRRKKPEFYESKITGVLRDAPRILRILFAEFTS